MIIEIKKNKKRKRNQEAKQMMKRENVSPYHLDNHPLNLAFVVMLS